jgi:hypothetical protein
MGHANVLVSISQEDEMRWKYHYHAHFYKDDGKFPFSERGNSSCFSNSAVLAAT